VRKVVDNILNNDQIKQLILFAQNDLNNDVTNHAGNVVPRRYTNEKWKYVFTRYDQNEFVDIAESISTAFPDFDIVSLRTMHYSKGASMGIHIDTYEEREGMSDHGLIIMLSDSKEFTGGNLIMSKELMDLKMGSGVLYSYVGEPHAVTPVKEGTRWIASVRMLRK
jgi:hypothetical protein